MREEKEVEEKKKPVPRKTPLADELEAASVATDQNKNGTLDALRSVFRNNEAGSINLNTCNSYLDTYLRDLPVFTQPNVVPVLVPDPRTWELSEEELQLILEQADLRFKAFSIAIKLPLPIAEGQHKPPVLKFLNLATNLSLLDRSIRESFSEEIQAAINSRYTGPKRNSFESIYAEYIKTSRQQPTDLI